MYNFKTSCSVLWTVCMTVCDIMCVYMYMHVSMKMTCLFACMYDDQCVQCARDCMCAIVHIMMHVFNILYVL